MCSTIPKTICLQCCVSACFAFVLASAQLAQTSNPLPAYFILRIVQTLLLTRTPTYLGPNSILLNEIKSNNINTFQYVKGQKGLMKDNCKEPEKEITSISAYLNHELNINIIFASE